MKYGTYIFTKFLLGKKVKPVFIIQESISVYREDIMSNTAVKNGPCCFMEGELMFVTKNDDLTVSHFAYPYGH